MQQNEFKSVEKTGRQMGFSWMPQVNTEPKYPDPFRPGHLTCFDYSKKLKDVLADQVVYHCRLLIAKHKTMTKMSEEQLQEYFADLQATAYSRAYKGLGCLKIIHGTNLYVQSHVRFAACTLASEYKKRKEKSVVLVPMEALHNVGTLSWTDAMQMAVKYVEDGLDDEASKLYEAIIQGTTEEHDGAYIS